MKLAIPDRISHADSPTGPVEVLPYQIVVPIRLKVHDILSDEFPAILDTGNNHNLTMKEEHVQQWAMPLRKVSAIYMNDLLVPLARADAVFDGKTLNLPEGIAVYPRGAPGAPRLPLLGLRAIVRCGLRLLIDGNSMTLE